MISNIEFMDITFVAFAHHVFFRAIHFLAHYSLPLEMYV